MTTRFLSIGFVLLFFVSILKLNAQSVEFTKFNFPNNKKQLSVALDEIKTGDKYYSQGPGVYLFAIEHYLKANEFNPNNAFLNYKIGRSYLNANDKANAIKYLEKAYSLDPKISHSLKNNNINYLLARAYHLNYEFDKAINKYKEHNNSLDPEQIAKQKRLIDKHIEECDIGKELVAKPARVFVDNLGNLVNSAYPDYSPLVIPEETMIIFTSSRENTTGGKRDKDSHFFEDIYITYYRNGNWTVPQNSHYINSNNHDATAGISADGLNLYIYKSSGGNILFQCELINNKYSEPEN